MTWTFTDDVERHAARVWPTLARDPARQTISMTVIGTARAGRRWSPDPMLFGSYADPDIRGAFSLTPPFELLIAALPQDAVDELVRELRARGVTLPGANGELAEVERFATAWTQATGLRAVDAVRLRLHELDTLLPPPRPPGGRARLADEDDAPLAARWFRAFEEEHDAPRTDVETMVRDRIGGGRLWLWEDDRGEPVALAGRIEPAAGVARIAPVYTAPARRRRGYATAVTAACTADAQRGAERVVLFTDLANPTSNSIYRQIGFRPVSDRRIVRFEP
jgi:RimJ/RimL family protein N-acetyltransferase